MKQFYFYKFNLDKSTNLNGFNYHYVSLKIQLNNSHLFTHSYMIKNSSISINLFAHS